MPEIFTARHTDALRELHDSLRAYVKSDQGLVEYLSANTQISMFTPRHAVWLINWCYRGGTFCLYDFVPLFNGRVPGEHYFRVKEAGHCIAEALRATHGIMKKDDNAGIAHPPRPPVETEEERVVKRELLWVLSVGSIKKELVQLEHNFKCVGSNRSVYPLLNEYASFANFDRRIRPLMLALELEAMPPRPAVERVTCFLKTLYWEVDKALANVPAENAPENEQK